MSHQPMSTSNATSNNGQPAAPTSPRHGVRSLDYLLARRSPAVYRAIHSAKVQRDESGVFGAKRRLAVVMHEHLKNQTTRRIAIEELRSELAVKEASEQFIATTPLAAPVDTVEGLMDRLAQLEQLRRRQPSAALAELDEVTRTIAAKQFGELEPCLAEVVALAPLAAPHWLTAMQRHLEGLSYPKSTKDGLARLANVVGRLQTLRQDRAALPPHKREAIQQRLVYAGHTATLAALREIACEQTIAAYRDHVAGLSQQLAAWQIQVAACERHISQLIEQLDVEATQSQQRQSRQSKAGLTVLKGPSADRVMDVLSQAIESTGDELVAKILETWMGSLAHQASHDFGQVVAKRPGELLARVPPAQGLLAFHEVIDDRLSELSLYATLRTLGIGQFAEQLYAKAAPLVQMERQSVELGLEFIDAAVLVLPEPRGPEDGRTLATLKNALASLGSVALRITANLGAELRLTRTLAGFPAAAQSINRSLLWGYAKSREHHHFPHLMALLPDSPDGRASDAALAVVQSYQRNNGAHHA